MQQYSFLLNESVGEYPDIDKKMSGYFAKLKIWFSKIRANWTFFKSCKPLEKESQMVKDVLKGLDVTVYAFPDFDRNAFVIPGFYVGCEKNADKMLANYKNWFPKHKYVVGYFHGMSFFSLLLCNQLLNLYRMRFYKLVNDPKKKGKKIGVFDKKITTPISIFVTYGMLNDATPDERLGVYLHEIGHWIDTAKSIPVQVLKRPTKEACYLYMNNFLHRFCTRYEELNADDFAKSLGYGQELSDALDRLVSVRKQIKWIFRIGDWMKKKNSEQYDKDEEIGLGSAGSYPSIKTRKEYLKDEK